MVAKGDQKSLVMGKHEECLVQRKLKKPLWKISPRKVRKKPYERPAPLRLNELI